MRKRILALTFGVVAFMSSAFGLINNQAYAQAPCPTGYSSVQSHWFAPFNDTWYTMCGCQAIKGYSASGSCTGSGGGNKL